MLKSVQIQNFRCLREVDVPLRPLTVLVGPNDSGKSAFLAALQEAVGHARCIGSEWDWWRGDRTQCVSIAGLTSNGNFSFKSDGRNDPLPEPNPLVPVELFLLPSEGVQMESQGYADTGDPPVIMGNGGQIPALLDHLLRRDRARFDQVIEAMRHFVPGFEKLEVATPQPDTRQIDVVIEDGFRIPADQTSVGVRLLLFFVALAYHPTPPRLILIEEPENGVHPKRLEDVIRLLREITQGKHGNHAAQVILTTHSPHLLDAIDLDQDQVLIFRRDKDGSRTAEPADKKRLANFLDEFMLGEVWFNEGEDGLVGREK